MPKNILMNALKTFATPSPEGILTIQLPEEYRQQSLEIIVLPLEDYDPPTKNSVIPQTKLSDKYKGIFTKDDAKSFNEHTQEMRNEWKNI